MVRLLIGLGLLGLAAAIWVAGINQFYNPKAFVPAEVMKVINETLMVTDENRQHLNRSTRLADELAFGFMGLLAGGVIAACSGRFSTTGQLVKAGALGVLLGGLTGALAGYIGHSFQAHVNVVENSTVHSVLRLIAMFLPFAIVVGLAAALSGAFKRDATDALTSAILGLLIGATIYGLASDANPATRETDTDIMPAHFRNRVLLISLVTVFISLMIAVQMLRKPKSTATVA